MMQASLEVRQAGRRTLSTLSGGAMGGSSLTILHYNDVYNIESRVTEPVGGAARFCTAIKSFSHLNPLVLFSGDIFSPSMCEYHDGRDCRQVQFLQREHTLDCGVLHFLYFYDHLYE